MAVLSLLLYATALPAAAAPVRGKAVFPDDPRGAARYQTYWRVPNGVLPVLPAGQDVRTESVVVLYPQGTVTGAQVAAAEAQEHRGPARVDMKLSGLKLVPPVLVVSPGTTVTLRNEDRVAHELAFTCNPPGGIAPRHSIAAGATAALTLDKPAECLLHSIEYAHIAGAVLSVERGFYGRLDGSGAFQFDAPEGHYLARLFFRGAFVASQPIDVLNEGVEITLRAGPGAGPASAVNDRRRVRGERRGGEAHPAGPERRDKGAAPRP